jgi:hypothetical protein
MVRIDLSEKDQHPNIHAKRIEEHEEKQRRDACIQAGRLRGTRIRGAHCGFDGEPDAGAADAEEHDWLAADAVDEEGADEVAEDGGWKVWLAGEMRDGGEDVLANQPVWKLSWSRILKPRFA